MPQHTVWPLSTSEGFGREVGEARARRWAVEGQGSRSVQLGTALPREARDAIGCLGCPFGVLRRDRPPGELGADARAFCRHSTIPTNPQPSAPRRARKVKDTEMKKTIAMICLCFTMTCAAVAESSREDLQARIDAARVALEQIMATPDNSIPFNILERATCVGVVPGMKKGAFVFGMQYGQGVVTCRTGHGWSAPVFIRMAGGSWGLQAGGQSTDLVLVAVNDRGFQDLLKSKFKIGGDASAAAGPVGRSGQAATDW